jgi:hypothetical protein
MFIRDSNLHFASDRPPRTNRGHTADEAVRKRYLAL